MTLLNRVVLSITLSLLFADASQSADDVKEATVALCGRDSSAEHAALERMLKTHYRVEHAECGDAQQPSERTYIAEGLAHATNLLSNLSLNSSPKVILGLYQSEYDTLIAQYPAAGNVVGIPRDPNPRSQLALAKTLFPSNPRLLLLYSKNSRKLRDEYRQYAAAIGVEIVEGKVDSEADALKIIKDSAAIDAILAIPDQTIYNRYTLPILLRTSYAFNLPMLGFSSQMVKIGSLATTYVETDAFHERVIASIQQWDVTVASTQHWSVSQNLNTARQSGTASISLNRSVAESLNMIISDNGTLTRKVNNMEESKRD